MRCKSSSKMLGNPVSPACKPVSLKQKSMQNRAKPRQTDVAGNKEAWKGWESGQRRTWMLKPHALILLYALANIWETLQRANLRTVFQLKMRLIHFLLMKIDFCFGWLVVAVSRMFHEIQRLWAVKPLVYQMNYWYSRSLSAIFLADFEYYHKKGFKVGRKEILQPLSQATHAGEDIASPGAAQGQDQMTVGGRKVWVDRWVNEYFPVQLKQPLGRGVWNVGSEVFVKEADRVMVRVLSLNLNSQNIQLLAVLVYSGACVTW